MNLRRFLPYVDNLWAPCLVLVLVYPFLTPLENLLFRYTEISFGAQLTYIFIYAILALGLNVVVGYTGLLHLGIAAFFGIGAYITGILRVAAYPFQFDFLPTLALSALGAALAGVCLGAPRCGCAATIWRSSRSASAKSPASRSATWNRSRPARAD